MVGSPQLFTTFIAPRNKWQVGVGIAMHQLHCRDAHSNTPMSRPKKNPILTQQPLSPNEKYIKVRLDPRTTVLLKNMKNFAFWKEKYPSAEVIG